MDWVKTSRETFWDLVQLILDVWWYSFNFPLVSCYRQSPMAWLCGMRSSLLKTGSEVTCQRSVLRENYVAQRSTVIDGALDWYPVMYSSLCNSFKDRAPVDFILGAWCWDQLHWFDLKIGHDGNSSSNGHQGDMLYLWSKEVLRCLDFTFICWVVLKKFRHVFASYLIPPYRKADDVIMIHLS